MNKQIDVLLVYPKVFTSSIEEAVIIPPLGLAYIAAVLEANNYTVRIMDMNTTTGEGLEFETLITAYNPKIVGFTCLTPFYDEVIRLANLIKFWTNATIVVGGAHATAEPNGLLAQGTIDYIVTGEGEQTMLDLVNSIAKNSPIGLVNGILYKDRGIVYKTPNRAYIQDLDNIPMPARHLLANPAYSSPQLPNKRVTSIITARGCPYQCIFCDYRFLMGPKLRRMSPGMVMREIKHCIKGYGANHISFRDSTFTIDEPWVKELCGLITLSDVKFTWDCNGRANLITMPMIQAMKEAGCTLISYGIESGNQAILDRANKRNTLGDIRYAIELTKKVGIETTGYYILGLPGDTIATMQDTVNFAIELNTDYTQFSLATPFPGTPMYNYALENNLLRDNLSWKDFSPIGKSIMRTEEVDFERLEFALKQAYRKYYLRPKYIWSRVKKLRPNNLGKYISGIKVLGGISK